MRAFQDGEFIHSKGEYVTHALEFFERLYYDLPLDCIDRPTTLKDKEGKEIYERDILETPDGFNVSVKFINTEGWCGVGVDGFISAYRFNSCKIIGNIHQNKDLIE